MLFQIKAVVLWPRRSGFEPRKLDFQLGRVNIISGASKTGKSAIIPIIDYCLCSDSCGIPVETIRNACEWFGIIIATDQGEMLFARKEPGTQKQTSEMYCKEAQVIDAVPNRISGNTTTDAIKSKLGDLCGLSRLDLSVAGSSTAFSQRVSFRDLMAFVFQPQNVVANPDVMFYKADTYQHREKMVHPTGACAGLRNGGHADSVWSYVNSSEQKEPACLLSSGCIRSFVFAATG